MKHRISGFTLIEMVVILLIIAVLSVEVVTQSTNVVTPMTVAAAASQLANDIRYTQALSMYTGQRYYLVAASGSSYNIQNGAGTSIVLANGSTVANFPAGVSFNTPTGFSNLIGFTGRGVPIVDTSGTLLTGTGTTGVSAGAYNTTISVAPTTGRVLIQ